MTAEMGVVTGAVPPRPSREQRASIAFVVGAVFALIFLVVASGSGVLDPPIIRLLLLAGPVASATVELLAAFGLASRRRWATSVVTPMLQTLLVVDAVGALLALARGTLQVPVGVLLAAWALRAPPADAGEVSGGRRIPPGGIVLAVAYLIATVAPFASGLALRPGGPLLVGESDLRPEIVVTGACVDPGGASPGAVPRSLEITYRWSWARAEPVVGGLDRLMVSWYVVSGNDAVSYVFTDVPQTDLSVHTEDMVPGGNQPSVTYGIDLGDRRYSDGEVRFTLDRAEQAPAEPIPDDHGSVEFRAIYTHGPRVTLDGAEGLWSHTAHASCEW